MTTFYVGHVSNVPKIRRSRRRGSLTIKSSKVTGYRASEMQTVNEKVQRKPLLHNYIGRFVSILDILDILDTKGGGILL